MFSGGWQNSVFKLILLLLYSKYFSMFIFLLLTKPPPSKLEFLIILTTVGHGNSDTSVTQVPLKIMLPMHLEETSLPNLLIVTGSILLT